MQAADFLSRFGFTVPQAAQFIMGNLNNPVGMFTTLQFHGLGTDLITQIVQSRDASISANQVRAFFAGHGLNHFDLDVAYFNTLRTLVPRIVGLPANDNLVGTGGANLIDGLAGNDSLDGMGGDDILIGGVGNDFLRGGWGGDLLEGGDGNDHLEALGPHFATWAPGYGGLDTSVNVLRGGLGDDTLLGGFGPDLLDGGAGLDWLQGMEGDDWLLGGLGNDTLAGGFGADSLEGGDGDDNISTGDDSDTDTVDGGAGNDLILANNNDIVRGGAGLDTIHITFFANSVTVPHTGRVLPGEGTDTITFHGLQNSHGVVLDLTEVAQMRDTIHWNLAMVPNLTIPLVHVRGFSSASDRFDILGFDAAVPTGVPSFLGDAVAVRSAALVVLRNFSQILNAPGDLFLRAAPAPATADQHGKGFFAVRGAAAAGDDTATVAAFLDPYGANHSYGSGLRHYFFVNIGSADSALYLFQDDGAANSQVAAAELTPIVRFIGLRTEGFSATQLADVFI